MNVVAMLLKSLGRRLPILDGSVAVSGIAGDITIRRDRFGVPHIEASTDADAWFGIGFCHGQDRPFQLETRLRAVRGTLAAMIGPEGLAIDELSRRIGFRRQGEAATAALDPAHRALADAYAAGVAAGVGAGLRRLPHPFVLLRTRPTRYQAADAFGFLALLSFSIASNWDVELARLKMLALDGPEAVLALDPGYPNWHPTTVSPGIPAGEAVAAEQIDRLATDLAGLAGVTGLGGGSNNWVLSAERTSTGRPILANDPHLAPMLPPHWYLLHVKTPEWAVAGASFPGAPAVPVGHNGHAAWGVTAGHTDNTDLFLEEMGTDGRSVRRGDRFLPCEVIPEVIAVKGNEPVDVDVLITDRGPIVGPALDGDVGAISLSATWLQARPAGGMFDLGRVESFEDLRAACRSWVAPPLNVVYADTGGTIGWQLAGEVPVRKSGSGAVPLPAWMPETGWDSDPLPFDELPHVADPDDGFLATANNLPDPGATRLGLDFLDGYRHSRITATLAERTDWDVPSTLLFQTDRRSPVWEEIAASVLAATEGRPETEAAARLLDDWDGIIGSDSAAAALFELFVAEMIGAVVEAKAPNSLRWALGRGFTPLVPFNGFVLRRLSHLTRLIREQPSGWFSDGWGHRIRLALATAHGTLERLHGPDPAGWGWGTIRPLTLRHPLGLREPLGRVFDLGPVPHGGDASTVNPGPMDPADPLADPVLAIASLRVVVDVGNWEHARFVLPGGQSGNPFSPHYADQFRLWNKGDAIPIAWSEPVVCRATRHTLKLSSDEPGSPARR